MSTWNTAFEQTPAGSESPALGDDRFRELKGAVRERFEKEHTMDLSSGIAGDDGWHESGSAKVYFASAAPTTRPDGTTALTAADNGRIWINTTDYKLRVYNHAAGATSADRWVLQNDNFPVGLVVAFSGEAASIPTGWLECSGSAISRTDYATLHSIMKDVGGTNNYGWGAGDGSTTFNVPDLREVYLVGVGTRAAGVTAHDAFNLAQMKDDQLQGHYHAVPTTAAGTTATTIAQGSASAAGTASTGSPSTDGTNGTPRTGTVTRGKGVGVRYIIKARSVDADYTSETANIDSRLTALEALGYGFRNKVINGNFDFWQRGVSQVVATGGTSSAYLADRFKVDIAGTSASTTYTREAFALGQTDVPHNPIYFARSACTNGGDSTNGVHRLIHYVEDVHTLAGEEATLTFWAKADSAKDLSIELVQAFGSGGSPSANVNTFIDKVALTTSWKKFTLQFTVPSISGKTIGTDGSNTSALLVALWLSAGSAYNSRTDTLGIQTGTFDFAQFQLEEGSVATKFEIRPIQLELALCQRYYEKSYDATTVPGTSTPSGMADFTGASNGSSLITITVSYKVTKRIPTANIAFYTAGGSSGSWNYDRSGASGTAVMTASSPGANAFNAASASVGAAWAPGELYGHWVAEADF